MRTLCLTLLFLFAIQSAFAQWSVKIDGGYMFPLAQTQLDPVINNTNYYNPLGAVTGPLTGSYGTLGIGPTVGIAFDHTFKSNITLELSGRYWFGRTSSFNDSSFSYNVGSSYYLRELNSYVDQTQTIHFYTISPTILYSININKKFSSFIGAGIDIAFGAKMQQAVIEGFYEYDPNPELTTLYQFNYSTTYNTTLGATGQLGIKYELCHHFDVFAGVQIDGFSLMPNKQLLNTETINGVAVNLGNVNETDKETDYVKSLPANANTNANEPGLQLGEPVPASTFGVFAGVEIKF